MNKLTVAFVKDVLTKYDKEEISFSRMVELLNEEVGKNIECEHPFKRLHWVDGVVFCNKCKKTLHK